MRVVIFGATGMIGQGVLRECLESPVVDSVTVVGRTKTGAKHDKITERVHDDLFDLNDLHSVLTGLDACFFCLGVSAIGLSEEEYTRITYDLTVSVAGALLELNPAIAFCYVSGAGTNSSASGRVMWARVKGKTENHLLEMPFRASYMFRPGYIQPLRGIKSKTRVYRLLYALLSPLYPVFRWIFPGSVTDTQRVGRAMIRAVVNREEKRILEAKDINRLAG